MKTKINILLVAIMFCSTSAFSQTNCKITYVSNEGFLIETANAKILVDALFGGFKANWCDIPDEETKVKLEKAMTPFDNVDIIAITHLHVDHFNADMVINHIMNNPNCMVICPKQVDSILASKANYNSINNNIVEVTPALNRDTTIKIKDIEIRVLRFEHSRYYELDSATGNKINRHRNTENIGFLFKTDNIKIFHCGDSYTMDDTEYRTFNLKDEQIDIALLTRLFMYHISAKGIEIIENYIKPKNIILMHIEPNNLQEYKDVASQIADRIPNIYMFEKPMEYKTYIIEKNN
jgi:L-ascorbate metabolism protein UlaG (beta-lactamase superfamily)